MWCAALPNGSPCTTGARCLSTICSDKKCVARAAVGAVCKRDNMCESGVCTAIGKEMRCTQKRKTGDACEANSDCASNFCQGYRCECALQSPALSFESLQGCAPPLSCIDAGYPFPSTFCGKRLADGEECNSSNPEQCLSGYCPIRKTGIICRKRTGDNPCFLFQN